MRKEIIISLAAACVFSASALSVSAAEVSGQAVSAAAQPVITKIENYSADSSKLFWTKSSGVDHYRVYIKGADGWKKVGETKDGYFIHKNLVSGQVYNYTLRGLDAKNNFVTSYNSAGWSNTFYTAPGAPKLNVNNSGVELTWNKVPGLDYYRVYRKTDGGSWQTVTDIPAQKYTDTSAELGVNYTYRVRAVNAGGNQWLSSNGPSASAVRFENPVVTKIENNSSSSSKIFFKKSDGIDRVRVYYKNGSGWAKVGDTSSGSIVHNNLVSGRTYTYTVRGLRSDGSFASGYNTEGYSNTFYTNPSAPKVNNTYTGVEIKWDRLLNFDYYRVYRKTAGESWKTLGDVKALSFVDNDVKPDTEYRYAVRVVNSQGNQWITAMSTPAVHHYYKAPSVNLFENQAKGVKIGWTKTAGANSYRVFVKENGSWKKLGDSNKLSFVDTAVKNNVSKIYTIRALDSKGSYITGFKSDGFKHTFYAPLENLKVEYQASGNYRLSWNKVASATAYRVYKKGVETGWTKLADVKGTSYTDTAGSKDTAVQYCVRALDGDTKLTATPSDILYYYNGKIAEGKVTSGGKTYYFTKGKFSRGYQKVNGKLYYFGSDGKLMKDTIVGTKSEGYYYADSNGVCCTSEEMRLAAEFLMNECTGKTLKDRAKTGFMVLANKYPYKRSYDHPKKSSDIPGQAIDMFKEKKGNCFKYAAAYTCVAKLAGYRTRMCVGATGNGSPHGWCEVLVNGKWLYCDPDANIPGYGNPPYTSYMMTYHYWNVRASFKSEVEIKDGNAVWK